MPDFRDDAVGNGPPLAERRVAIVSSAGLVVRGEKPFRGRDPDYRVIPSETRPDQLMFSHISINLDRSGFQEDWNVVFPLDRLRELAAEGVIGSVAATHYSFMGATDPLQMEGYARDVALAPQGRRGRRRSALPRLTALHARRERAGALSRGRGHPDCGDQPHSGANRKHQAAACPLGPVRAGPPVRSAERCGVPEARDPRGIAPARTRARSRDHRGFSRKTIRGNGPTRAGDHPSPNPTSIDGSATRLAAALEDESERVEAAYGALPKSGSARSSGSAGSRSARQVVTWPAGCGGKPRRARAQKCRRR